MGDISPLTELMEDACYSDDGEALTSTSLSIGAELEEELKWATSSMGATGQAQRPTVQAELEALPDEILLYIFCFLSAETLSVMGQGGMFPGSWKRLYSQLDERSCRRAVKEAEEGFPAHADLSRAVLSVEVAKRREAVLKAESSLRGPAQMLHTILCGELHPLQKTSAKEPQASQDDEVARWRARRDMRIGGDSAGHVCRSGCAMDQLSTSVYICRMSGRVHRCGNECDSAQPEDGQLVCALSGAVVGEVLEAGGDVAHPLVEQGPHDEGGGAEGGADEWGTAGPIGGLGKLFVEGYASALEECPFMCFDRKKQ